MKPLGFLVLPLLIGCKSIQEYSQVTEIITDPPGARITVDDDYVGDSPIKLNLRYIRRYDGFGISEGETSYWITAIPRDPGQYEQSALLYFGDSPERVFLNMWMHRVNSLEVDLNISLPPSQKSSRKKLNLSDLGQPR